MHIIHEKKKDWEKSLCLSIHQTIFNPQKRWNLFRRQNEWTAFPGRTKNGWINLQQKKNQQGQRLNCSFCFTFDKIQIINEKYSLTLRNWIGVNKWSSQSVFFFQFVKNGIIIQRSKMISYIFWRYFDIVYKTYTGHNA